MKSAPKNGTPLSVIKVILAGVLFGTAGTAVTFAPAVASPAGLGIGRVFIGAIFLIAILPKLNGDRKVLLKLVKHPFVWVMAIGSAAYQPLFFGATQRNGVGLSTLVTVGCIPIFTGIIGRLYLKEPISKTWLLATVLAILGLIIRSWGIIELKNVTGLFMAMAAGISVAFYLNAAKIELRKGEYLLELPAIAYLLGSFLLLPFLIHQDLSWAIRPSGFFVWLYLGVVTMAIANSLQISGLKALASGPTATLMLTDPFTATLLSIFVLKEDFGILPAIGLILVAVALIWQSYTISGKSRTQN